MPQWFPFSEQSLLRQWSAPVWYAEPQLSRPAGFPAAAASASILITILAEMSNIERSNIVYRLNSGRSNYIAKGGKLGRKTGSIKTEEKKREEYKEVIQLLKKGYSVRNVAKLQGIGISTVQRVKNIFVNA